MVLFVPLTGGPYTGKLCAAVSATRVRLLQKCAIDLRRLGSVSGVARDSALDGESTTDSAVRRANAAIRAEQASVLEGRGVDFFSVETFFELEELEARAKSQSR